MTTTPLPPRPGEPTDPELRDRYLTDAAREREERRVESVRLAAEPAPSRTPVGAIRVIALLVTTVLVAGAGLSLLGPMLKQSETTDYQLSAAGELDFEGAVGDVRVRAAEPGESPRAVATSTWGLREPRNSVRTSGGATRVTSHCPSPGLGTVCEVDWLIVVPADTELDIEHGVGQVTVEGASGDLDVQVGVGDVTVTEATGERFEAEVGVGALEYEAVEPPRVVEARVGVGELVVRVPDTVRYRVDTGNGAAEVANSLGSDPGASRRIILEPGLGAVRVDPS